MIGRRRTFNVRKGNIYNEKMRTKRQTIKKVKKYMQYIQSIHKIEQHDSLK